MEDISPPPHSEVVMKGQFPNSREGDYITELSERCVEHGCALVVNNGSKEVMHCRADESY